MSISKEEQESDDQEIRNISANLETVLNKHGFSFQFAVVRQVEGLYGKRKTNWNFIGTEIPVASGGDVTHIDFVMKQYPQWHGDPQRAYMIAECKRVDPAKGFWCFAKSPYSWRNQHRHDKFVQFDWVEHSAETNSFTSSTRVEYVDQGTFDLVFELKTGETGDGTGGTYKSAANAAVTQVLRGSRGYIQYLARENRAPDLLEAGSQMAFIPVIFTTARLFVTTSDITASDMKRGRIAKESIELEEKSWIWFNHNRSLNLTHDLVFDYSTQNYHDSHFKDFTRTVAIVSCDGIEEFLRKNFPDWLRHT